MKQRKIERKTIIGILVVALIASVAVYHAVDVRGDLRDMLDAEYTAVVVYTELSEPGKGRRIDNILNILRRNVVDEVKTYDIILADEREHVKMLEKYVTTDKEIIGFEEEYIPEETLIKMAIEGEKEAIERYEELLDKIYLHRGLKEDLQRIYKDEKAHLEMWRQMEIEEILREMQELETSLRAEQLIRQREDLKTSQELRTSRYAQGALLP